MIKSMSSYFLFGGSVNAGLGWWEGGQLVGGGVGVRGRGKWVA